MVRRAGSCEFCRRGWVERRASSCEFCRRGWVVRRANSCKVVRAFLSDWSDLSDRSDKSCLPGKRTTAADFAATAACPSGPQGPQGPSCKVFREQTCASAFVSKTATHKKLDFFANYYCTLQKNVLQYKRRTNLIFKHIGGFL